MFLLQMLSEAHLYGHDDVRKWHVVISDSHLAARVAAGGERGEGGGGGGEG